MPPPPPPSATGTVGADVPPASGLELGGWAKGQGVQVYWAGRAVCPTGVWGIGWGSYHHCHGLWACPLPPWDPLRRREGVKMQCCLPRLLRRREPTLRGDPRPGPRQCLCPRPAVSCPVYQLCALGWWSFLPLCFHDLSPAPNSQPPTSGIRAPRALPKPGS